MHDEPLRLIEDCLPLDIISERAAREKGQRAGNLASIHIWWGRKPMIASRAALYATLVPAPHDDVQRKAYLRQLTLLCATDIPATTLAEVQRQIADVHADQARPNQTGVAALPLVVDLFAGGGSIPLEALRLGCRTLAGDLNPVAYLIEHCTLVYPQRFPELASLVDRWGRRVFDAVRSSVSDLYPPLPIVHPDTSVSSRKTAIPSAYLWTRIVVCPNPQCSAAVPLTQHTWLVNRPQSATALRIVPQPDLRQVAFTFAQAPSSAQLGFAPDGLSARGNARCFCCGATVESSYVKQQGKANRLGTQLMATVSRHPTTRARVYLAAADIVEHVVPSDEILNQRIAALCAARDLTLPNEPIFSADSRAFFTHLYGLERFSDLFTPRQLLVLLTFADQVRQAHAQMLAEGMDPALARAVTTYLAFLVDRLADWNSSLCKWAATSESISDTFSRQALPMAWNFAEIYPFGDGSGNLHDALAHMVETIRLLARIPSAAEVTRGPAHQCELPDSSVDAVITDPPYYDNVSYADLSDFFYVWLKRTVGDLYPEHFGSDLTPKKWEAIADPTRHHGDRALANAFYTDIIQRSLVEAHRILKPAAPLVLVYAHKTTAGWASMIEALRAASFTVTEAWPINTESRGRVRAQSSAALASSIFIVARKRTAATTGNYTRDVLPELRAIVRERVQTLTAAGIGGADLVVATVGGGLRAYTRFARVERDNGEALDASTFLEEVQRTALATILEYVVGLDQSGVSTVDAASQYYVLARYQYGTADIDFDDANVLARGVGIELDGPGSLTSGVNAVLVKDKQRVQLRDYHQRGAARELGISNDRAAALIDILHRLLWLNEHQPAGIPTFLAQVHPDPMRLKLVAEALAGKRLAAEPTPGVARDERTEEQKAIGRLLPVWKRVVEDAAAGRGTAIQTSFREG
jgi:putative DNA methylase